MSYIVLARKWRPNTFKDITGQDFITTTLKNSISSGKLAHAILFSGPRGVGKTSTARIVAMSINCINGPTETPCQNCTHCTAIKEGKSLDVIEIDAASHTGVNDVREIIDNIKYLPVSARNKIYIIDEIHMLSNSAFNALLKTLEEPPGHVVFLMATTEAVKIPLTILSRCQRFDFSKVSASDIKYTLTNICKAENIVIDNDTLHLIAVEADGSLRDALSLLDQLNTTFDSDIKYQDAVQLFGFIDKSSTMSLFENILKQDPKECLNIVLRLNTMGINPKKVISELLRIIRYAVFIKTCGDITTGDLGKDEKNIIEDILTDINLSTIENIFNLTLKATEEIQKSHFPDIALEMNIVKLAIVKHSVTIEKIMENLERLKTSTSDEKHDNTVKTPIQRDPKINHTGKVQDARRSESSKTVLNIDELTHLIKSNSSMTGIYLENADEIELNEEKLTIKYNTKSIYSDKIQKSEHLEKIKDLIKQKYSYDVVISVLVDDNVAGNENTDESVTNNRNAIIESKPLKDALEIFGGKIIKIKKGEH
jgi:DNA polymerase III subunit gamma/tau